MQLVDTGQAKRLRAHFEAARRLSNALLGEAMKRLRQMRTDPVWQWALSILQAHKQVRKEAFSQLRQAYGFSEYALHDFVNQPIAACFPLKRFHFLLMQKERFSKTRCIRSVYREDHAGLSDRTRS